MSKQSGWVFQGNRIAKELPGWSAEYDSFARANASRIEPGQPIYYWQSGPEGGIYGVGRVREKPTATRRFTKDGKILHRVACTLVRNLADQPILRSELLTDSILRNLDVIRRPWGPNFSCVTSEQVSALGRFLNRAEKHRIELVIEPPDDEEDRQQSARRVRAGHARLRVALRRLYHDKCAITDTGPTEVLDACHIRSHSRTGQNDSRNGLLLRTDLHALFDARLLSIEPVSLTIHIHDSLRGTVYGKLHGQKLRQRADGNRPNKAALNEIWNTRRK